MRITEKRIQALWEQSDEFWEIELSRFHPMNAGNEAAGNLTTFELNTGFHKGKELAEWVHNKILGFVNDNLSLMKSVICNDLDYCNSLKKKILDKEGWKVAISVSDSLTAYATGIPIPIGHLSVYLIRYHLLDKICACETEVGNTDNIV